MTESAAGRSTEPADTNALPAEEKVAPPSPRRRTSGGTIQNVILWCLGELDLRRGLIFATNIGLPCIAADLAGQQQLVLYCGFIGIFFSFADTDGALANRWAIGALVFVGVVCGGLIGHLFGAITPTFWIVYALLLFVAGYANQTGRTAHLASRYSAIALVVGLSIPPLTPSDLLYLAFPISVVFVTRTLDQLIAGRSTPPVRLIMTPPATQAGWLRFALAYAGAGCAALWFAQTVSPDRLMWVPAITLAVLLPDMRASYQRIVDTMLGAFFGAVLAWFLTEWLRAASLIYAGILLLSFLLPSQLPRFWLHTAILAALILLLFDLAYLHNFDQKLLVERLQDMLLGCGIALVGTTVAFRNRKLWPDESAR